MKYILIILTLTFSFTACDNASQTKKNKQQKEVLNPVEGEVYGNKISQENIYLASSLESELKGKDQETLKLEGTIDAVCQMSGCWIDMEIGNNEIVHITFKDEAFTLPKDVAGKNAVIEGIAFKEIVPVDQLKKAAKAEGKSQEEIDAITKPKTEYYFEAEGVTLK